MLTQGGAVYSCQQILLPLHFARAYVAFVVCGFHREGEIPCTIIIGYVYLQGISEWIAL